MMMHTPGRVKPGWTENFLWLGSIDLIGKIKLNNNIPIASVVIRHSCILCLLRTRAGP